MPDFNRISIVIPSLHSPVIDQVLDALHNQSLKPAGMEVLVVGLDKYNLVREDEMVHFLSTKDPASPARARNIGWKATSYDAVVFLDADCVPLSDWLLELAAFAREHEDAGAVLSGMEFDSREYWTVCDQVAGFHEHFSSNPSGRRLTLPSYALYVPKRVLQQVDGFDESFPLPSAEDLDMSIRIRQLGYGLYFNREAVVIHRPRRNTFRDLWRHAYWSGHESIKVRLRYEGTYRMPPWSRSALAWRILSPGIAVLRTIQIYAGTPNVRSYWLSAPWVMLSKLAWCWGAAAGLESLPSHTNPEGLA
jgi:glycosyltransferase involved in cell wall biosynthesis